MTPSVLILYTGGTIGMTEDSATGALVPFNFSEILSEMPVLKKFGYKIDVISFDPLIDSSDIQPPFWIELAKIIKENYNKYTGFVVLHGTDTMSFSASALSFILQDLEKPIVFTGSQLPIGTLRTDGKENFISAIEIAAACDNNGHAIVPEVCIFFQNQLFRGNRTTKDSSDQFHAFRSPNYPQLADAGIHIKYYRELIRYPKCWGKELRINENFTTDVALLKLYPGIQRKNIEAVINIPGLRAIVLETFGAGNAPTIKWFIDCISEMIAKDIMVVNITQCPTGCVDMETYATGKALLDAGVVSGLDLTTEAAIVKLIILSGQNADNISLKEDFSKNISGEYTNYLF